MFDVNDFKADSTNSATEHFIYFIFKRYLETGFK